MRRASSMGVGLRTHDALASRARDSRVAPSWASTAALLLAVTTVATNACSTDPTLVGAGGDATSMEDAGDTRDVGRTGSATGASEHGGTPRVDARAEGNRSTSSLPRTASTTVDEGETSGTGASSSAAASTSTVPETSSGTLSSTETDAGSMQASTTVDSEVDSGSGAVDGDVDAPVDAGEPQPTLADLFAGTAQFQTDEEAEVISLTFAVAQPVWDQKKLAIQWSSADGNYYAFTRKVTTNSQGVATFNIVLMVSTDGGQSFTEVAEVFDLQPGISFYDVHVSINTSVSPPEAVMVMECNAITPADYGATTGLEWASTCVSTSTDPFTPTSWSYPTVLVYGCNGAATSACPGETISHSASTPVTLFDGTSQWIAWTGVVENGDQSYADTEGATFPGALIYANQGAVLMGADANVECTDWWDCDNRDKQDWATDGTYYYFAYNGANYYSCQRPTAETGSNRWGVTIAQSPVVFPSASQFYRQLPVPLVLGEEGYCNAAYPSFAVIDGNFYLYYVNGPTGGPFPTKRMQLIWSTPPTPPTSLTCGVMGGGLCDNGSGVCRGQGTATTDCPLCCAGAVSPSCGDEGGGECQINGQNTACGNVGPTTFDCDFCCGGSVSADNTCGGLGGTLCGTTACTAYGGQPTGADSCPQCCTP